MKDLILVESPTKAKTLFKFLKGKYDIEASLGHIRDLPKGNLGVDIENNFAPKYVIPNDKRKLVEALKNKVKDADRVILATDPDREGEAIAHHLYEIFKKEAAKNTDFKRIVFHEITPEAIDEALGHPRGIDENLVSAQTARRVLDRIVGYKLSPVLWKKIKRKLSAGRVQSIALRLIVEREKEINNFQVKTYNKVFVILSKKQDNNTIEFELVSIDGGKIEKTENLKLYDGDYRFKYTTLDKKTAQEIQTDLDGKKYTVTDVTQKENKRSPYPPFTTSTLSQEAFRRLGFTSKRTMRTAQRLYEEGFITYHRTDSFNLSKSFVSQARGFIEKQFGKDYLSPTPRAFATKSKMAQEAHEAIRPTSIEDKSGIIGKTLGRDFSLLYSLIYKRAMATQMADAIYASTKIEAQTIGKTMYTFEANGRILKFPGFLKLWYYEEEEQILPEIAKGEELEHHQTKITDHTSNPPPRYNEASLISSLEKHGIGRPSTYAPIISTITERDYIEKQDGKFVPTPIGTTVSDFLVNNFSEIDDIPFTASMEDQLDNVAEGKEQWTTVLKDFYGPFEQKIVEAEGQERVNVPEETTGEKCPECGQGELVLRRSKFGKFYACNRFPDCTYKKSFQQETDLTCPQDGGKIIIKRTKKGRIFYGCSNYPNCTFAAWKKEDIGKPAPTAAK